MSLLDQLAKINLKSRGKVEKDNSGPLLTAALDESNFSEYQNEVLDVNIEEWIGPLAAVTFPTHFIPITTETAKALMFAYENNEDHLKKLRADGEEGTNFADN